MVDDDEDDADSVTASAADHLFVRLSKFFSDRYPSLILCPLLRFLQGYGFELLFAYADPRGSSRPHFRLYPRVAEVMPTAHVRAAALSRNKPSFGCLP